MSNAKELACSPDCLQKQSPIQEEESLNDSIIKKIDDGFIKYTPKVLRKIVYFVCVFMCIHAIFWGIEQIYFNWCVGQGFYGFFTSIVTNQSGVCSALRSVSSTISSSSTNLISAGVASSTLFLSENTAMNKK